MRNQDTNLDLPTSRPDENHLSIFLRKDMLADIYCSPPFYVNTHTVYVFFFHVFCLPPSYTEIYSSVTLKSMYRLPFLGEIADSRSGAGKVQDELRTVPAGKQADTYGLVGACQKEQL